MDWWSVVEIGIGVLAGGLISAYFSWQGTKELRREAERLREQTELLMRGVEEMAKSGDFEWNRNEQGQLVGIAFKR